jgi:hypothetical protein
MLNLASFFHLNLMYSSIPEEARSEVIRRCYHPLLDLASPSFPVSLEATALTLEMIDALDPGWTAKLKAHLELGVVEFVGSGYSQIIAPLVPGTVNQANLTRGMETYEALLGDRPKIWLVNEMAYSGGLPELYAAAGAQALVMEWNNTWKGHPEWEAELRYHHQKALGCEGTTLPVVWVDTIDFQKFQRLAHGQLEREDWVAHWAARARTSLDTTRYATLYGSDAEVFDFRPGRYAQEGRPAPEGEWQAIRAGLEALAERDGIQMATLGQALTEESSAVCGLPLRLECARQPVVVKKQEKYNLNRWAVTGRGDLEINTACFRRARELVRSDINPVPLSDWRDLLWHWSSDFRTHITAPRWDSFRQTMWAEPEPEGKDPEAGFQILDFDRGERQLELENAGVKLSLDLTRGLALKSANFPGKSDRSPLGTLPHGYFDDIAFGADFFTGHVVVQYPGQPKLTDLQTCGQTTTLFRRPDGALLARAEIRDGDLKVSKTVGLAAHRPEIILAGHLELPSRQPGEIHPFHLTVVPGFFDLGSLEYRTHNGGVSEESFSLRGDPVHHGASYSTLVSAKGGLGATEGVVTIGDGKYDLVIRHDPTVSALIPTLRFEKVRGGNYFLRVRYSAQEIDETFVSRDEPWCLDWQIGIEIVCHGEPEIRTGG